jgi:5-methylcytosine-specific restriction endonuclease McrA
VTDTTSHGAWALSLREELERHHWGSRAAKCGTCGVLCEPVDMHFVAGRPAFCWPCWDRFASTKPYLDGYVIPTGWYQLCERCDARNWVTQDRPLCPSCVRVPGRWRATFHMCKYCGGLFRPTSKRHKFCCGSAVRGQRLVEARRLGTHTGYEWECRQLEFGFACAYCGITGVMLTKDHIVPISRGGSDGIDNIVPACTSCNSSKSGKLLSEWGRALIFQP